jgi:hypothetical protein
MEGFIDLVMHRPCYRYLGKAANAITPQRSALHKIVKELGLSTRCRYAALMSR